MLTIRNAEGLTLLLPAATRFTTETVSAWLTDDDWPSGFSYPIRFPLSEQNQRFLGPGYRPGMAAPIMSLTVTVALGGMLYRQCTLDYRITKGEGDGYLRIDGGEVYARLKNLKLGGACAAPVELGPLIGLAQRMLTYARDVTGTYPCTFFPVRNDGFFEAEAAQKIAGFTAQPYLNYWDGARFSVEGSGSRLGYPIVPFFYLSWVLQKCLATIGYQLGGSWPQQADMRCKVLFNQTALNLDSVRKAGDILGTVFAIVTAQPADHLPDMNVGDLFKALRSRFGLLILFDSSTRICTFDQIDEVVAGEEIDLTPYLTGGYSVDAGPGSGLAITQGLDSADELWKIVGKSGALEAPADNPILFGPGRPDAERTKLTLPVAPIQQTFEDTPDKAARWLIPTVRQRGNHRGVAYNQSEVAPTEEGQLRQSTSLRFVDTRGLQADSAGRYYPLGTTALALDGRQQPIPGATPLRLDDELRFALGTYYAVRDVGRPLTLPVRLPVAIVNQLTGQRPLRVDLDRLGLQRVLQTRLRIESPGPDAQCVGSLEVLELPAGAMTGPAVAPAPVYIELISLTREYALSAEVRVSYVYLGERTRLSVRCWADAARKTPATAQALLVTVRRRRTHGPFELNVPQRYEETLQTYPVSGTTAVLERGWITKRYTGAVDMLTFPPNTSFPDYTTTWQLEIGPGYRVLPPISERREVPPGYRYDPTDLGPV